MENSNPKKVDEFYGTHNANQARHLMREVRERIDAQIMKHCVVDSDGMVVRGYVEKTMCCGVARWNDGTKCVVCKHYSQLRHEEDSFRL